MAFSELEGFDRVSHLVYFNKVVTESLTDYSEVLVEALAAYYLVK